MWSVHPTPGLKSPLSFLKMVSMAPLTLIWMILQKILLGTERGVTPRLFLDCVLSPFLGSLTISAKYWRAKWALSNNKGLEHSRENVTQWKIRTGRSQSRINSYKWAEHFREVLNKPDPAVVAITAQPLGDKLDIVSSVPTKKEILNAIKSLKNNKAPQWNRRHHSRSTKTVTKPLPVHLHSLMPRISMR